jgi:peptide/nickel transport system ATP-binding protein
MSVSEPAIELRDLEVVYRVRGIDRPVLRGLTLTIEKGESYGLVGESGCGKTTAAFTIMRYLPRNGRVVSGSIRADGADLLQMSEAGVRRLRASTVSMVYQNPGAALNPSIRIGTQIAEVFQLVGLGKDASYDRAREMLRKVQISDPAGTMRRYPHQLSGGGQQRVVIAMALASDPTLLILDEPTTGLDATVEAEVLDLVAALRQEFGTSVLFISHNLGVIRRMCERVGVLYAGRLVEEGDAETVFTEPRHPYTVGLLRCIPRGGLQKDRDRLDTIPGYLPQLGAPLPGCVFAPRCGLVKEVCHTDEPPLHPIGGGHFSRCHFHERAAELPRATQQSPVSTARATVDGPVVELGNASKTFSHEGNQVRALVDVDLAIGAGETLGLVGESGSGKTTLARVLLGLTAPDPESTVELAGEPLAPRIVKRSNEQVRALQTVFQNPDSALNRRSSVRRIIGRAITKLVGVRGEKREERLREIAASVRFDERLLSVRPVQLSGGLKQRVAIGRAFAGDPRVVVCDEPTSALDVSVQAAILNLLADLQAAEGVTYLFISHDLGVVRYLSDRIAVLYLGRLMELGPAEVVFNPPHHPYTEALLSAVPTLAGEERPRIRLEGEIPSAADPPTGCVFHTRCPRFLGAICQEQEPPLAEVEPGHLMRCHIPVGELRALQADPPPPHRRQSKTTS